MRLPETITIKTSDVRRGLQDTTFTIRYSGPLRFRFWLAMVLLRFAAWIVGATADVAREDEAA